MKRYILTAFLGLMGLLPSGAQAAPKCPNLTILLDQSGSMTEDPMGNKGVPVDQQKWTIAKNALDALVTQYDGRLPIGLSLFASDGTCGAAQLDIPPAIFTKQKIIDKLAAATPNTQTPTAASITSLTATPQLRDTSRKQFIMLVTDGSPSCTAAGYPTESAAKAATALSTAANSTTAPVKTFVVGFGNLTTTEVSNMNDMADAGGLPTGDATYHYYRADSSQALVTALDKILTVVIGDVGSTTCDDTCYGQGCPNAGDKCIAAMCKPDPCAGVTCGANEYCYTDGTAPGVCAKTCAVSCNAGEACDRNGACVADPCGQACGAGQQCNPTTSKCETDARCAGITCLGREACIAGKCVDDPCQGLVTCPSGTTCRPFDGTCQGGGTPGTQSTGCQYYFSQGSVSGASAALAGLLFGLLLLRRRRTAFTA